MLTWIRNLRNTRSRQCPPSRTSLGFESLETREVPALLGLGVNLGLSLGTTSLTVALGSSSGSGSNGLTLGLGGAQVSVPLGQAPSTPAPTPEPGPSTPPTGTASVFGAVRYSRFGGDEVGPVVGATVTLADANGNVVASTTTDASGNYSLGSLKAGSYTLRVSSEFGIATRSVELADGQAVNLNFAFND
jgi:hypothetical protein